MNNNKIKAFIERASDGSYSVEQTTMLQQLDDIANEISWGRLSKEYFGKSSSWIYNKLHGRDGNGGVGGFTEAEKQQLQKALYDIADRIRRAASTITQ